MPNSPRVESWRSFILRRTLVLIVVLAVLWNTFRSIPADPRATAFIVMEPTAADVFLVDLRKTMTSHDLKSTYSTATSDTGQTDHVVRATGRGLYASIANVPLSVDAGCFQMREAGFDPGQFELRVMPSWWFPFRGRAVALFQAVVSDLKAQGYVVLSKPAVPCSTAYLREAPSK